MEPLVIDRLLHGLCFGGGLVASLTVALFIKNLMTGTGGATDFNKETLVLLKGRLACAEAIAANTKRAADAEEMRNQILIRQMSKEQGLQAQMIQAFEKPQCQCTKCVAIRNIFKNGGLPPTMPPGNPGNN